MKVLRVTNADLVLPLIKEFVEESSWGWTYNENNSRQSIQLYIENPETDVFLALHDEPAGFAIVAYDEEFHDERIGYISKFYISKRYRKTRAGRELARATALWFDFHNCRKSFATDTANVGEGKAFINLMGKYGFHPCGETLVRGKNEQD